jgi:hypothetical protein
VRVFGKDLTNINMNEVNRSEREYVGMGKSSRNSIGNLK